MLREYFNQFVGVVEKIVQSRGIKRVLDIACNDGSQLAAFAARGWQTWGIDPALNLASLSRATKAQIVCAYWTKQIARELGMTYDAIVAQNVLAHVSDPLAFLKACRLVMHANTKIFIQTSQADMFRRTEFDAIYHEHVSFFSTRSMQTLAQQAGLVLEAVLMTHVHGGSYVFVLGFGPEGKSVTSRLTEEERLGRYRPESYYDFADRARGIVRRLKTLIEELKGYRIVGFGAAAKGNTLLNFAQIELRYIVDSNPLKQGLLTPGMNILICPPERLIHDSEKLAILVFAWNFLDEICDSIRRFRSDQSDLVITCFPEPSARQISRASGAERGQPTLFKFC
jgi:2-polyprenyl-3-methyl-5-hydroxy-6-metoxy-1,4-benzoquinol methylase